ncbi:MAG: YjbQ family protein [Deltaproteobacteria bacterium]|nr:YjbQ family protein [Deltaproteobacteria bacterium]
MAIKTLTIQTKTSHRTDIIDIGPQVNKALSATPGREGFVHLFVPGSTAALTTIEYEEGVVRDLQHAIERLAPENITYEHDRRWGDGNGYAHVRAALLGPSLTIPLSNGRMLLGTWQQIVLCDFDNRPRTRDITVQIHTD